MAFQRVERSYCTPEGWRLATFEEARNGLEAIKEQNHLERWDRARLLDGWITGPGYNFQIGNDFKGCLGYMLLIRTEASGCAYADVNISDSQKEVALFLCADDCNFEVVYWLFNSWAKTDSMTMDLQDVIHGRIPFSNPEKFKEMNNKVCSLARKLGDKGPVSARAAQVRFSGPDSVKDVLSDMIEIVNEENLQQYRNEELPSVVSYMKSFFPISLAPDWLEDFAKRGGADWTNIADAFWNFLSECFAGLMVEVSANDILANICQLNNKCNLKTIKPSQENFMVASLILLYLSNWRRDIIHTPLAHGCSRSCAAEMLCYVASKNGQADLPSFNQTLEKNAMWSWYDDIRNYDLLNKLLVLVASGKVSPVLGTETEALIFVVNRLLECGAQSGPAYTIFSSEKVTALSALFAVIRYYDDSEDGKIQLAKSLFDKYDEKKQKQLANTPYEHRWTALHWASHWGEANTCKMLLDYGAKLDVPDEDGKTALQIAVEKRNYAVVNVFMKHPHIDIIELVTLKDKVGKSPLDTAVASRDEKLLAMLLFKSKQPEAYFDKVDLKDLLRYSLMNGLVDTVRNLLDKGTKLPAGECDDQGKTGLHLAAMCEDDSKAKEMVDVVFENIEGKENLVAKGDRSGRTALHEAALHGNIQLCIYLLKINSKIIVLKDRDGRSPIYDAVKGKHNEKDVIQMFLAEYSKTGVPLNALIDRNGLTPLHVAASIGKKDLVKLLLSSAKKRDESWKTRDLATQEASEYLKRSDFLGQTALHKAANCGDPDTVEILLKEGAHPLQERDCDGRTALHYAVKAKTGGDKIELAKLLLEGCKTNEEKLLLLWASAAGLGTADDSLSKDDPLRTFLENKKNEIKAQLPTGNLLKTAASLGDIEMTKELITRGYQIGDIRNTEWRKKLTPEREENVKRVSGQLERIAQQGNDHPTVLDNLGRIDYAYGLAALLLNPYIKPPIVVGISGSWGMGKSSLMIQTESILLKTAAQVALLPSSSASELPDTKTSELSIKGKKKYEEIRRHVDFEQKGSRTLLSTIMDKIGSWVKKSNREESRAEIGHTEQDSLEEFLNSYQPKYHKIFKSLAAMDSSDMFTTRSTEDQEPQNPPSKSMWRMVRDVFRTNHQLSNSSSRQSTADSPVEESVPAVLTVNYNAWRYRNETEALAGMAVEITKELEGIMTEAQWLSTCWRYTWEKKKYNIWVEIIYPCLLAVVLASTITWILWVILDRVDKLEDWAIPKFACLPTGIVITGWTVTKSVMGIVKPVSTQLMNYMSFPDHTHKLGYQERVISDITFLRDEIGKRPCMIFKAYSWVFSVISTLWLLFLEWWVTPLLFHPRSLENTTLIPNMAPASGTNLRLIVFIEDLDRCQESVILQVLSAINLVLAVCEINVVLGIDKGLIERAIIKKYGDTKSNKGNRDLADKYLQKIIQLPLDLPDPSEEQSRKFLETQLGIFQEPSEGADSELNQDAGIRQETYMPENETGSEIIPNPQADIEMQSGTVAANDSCSRPIFQFFKRKHCKLFPSSLSGFSGRNDETQAAATLSAQAQQQGDVPIARHAVNTIRNGNYWSWIPIRELLFVRYSKGEQDAFCYFQTLATDTRKFPREWKRYLNYHRLVWYIFYLTRAAKDLAGWQVQLITWTFVSWEWRENMDFVIQNWKKIGLLKSSPSDGPTLQMIVDHFIELERKENLKMARTIHDEEEETKETSVSKDKNIEIESSKREHKKLEEADKDNMVTEDVSPTLFQGKNNKKKKKNKEVRETGLEGTLRKELDELKKEIKVLKDEVMKQQTRKNEKREEEKRMKLKRWETLRSALEKYDVSMGAIQAFQRFRFYCIAGHLSWPLPEQFQGKKNVDSYED